MKSLQLIRGAQARLSVAIENSEVQIKSVKVQTLRELQVRLKG